MQGKVLVATRGEIAIRIIRAARELGLQTVAIYEHEDKDSLHVLLADDAYPVSSYLSIRDIVEVGVRNKAYLVHPGYGFLAENPEFARAVEKAGMVFVGPRPEAMRLAGDKVEAKRAAEKLGIRVLPWSRRPVADAEDALSIARKLGFPVMIKAVAGGGGMGIRVARNGEELVRYVKTAMIEAERAFGSPLVYVEKYLERPRHVEVQILADNYDNIVHLYERECSIQRRYQKIVEEAPSPALSPDERAEATYSAVKLARGIGYTNAGTVEFLYADGNLYFTEINARLQVEHGVTEMATGIDIVKQQLLIAMDRELEVEQRDIVIRGWAFEARIYAEDPLRNFEPSPGRIGVYHEPGGPGVRVDSCVYAGYTIPDKYNPLIAKLITWGSDRNEALSRMRRALAEYIVSGVKTNIQFLKKLFRDPEFEKGEYDVSMLARKLPYYVEAIERENLVKGIMAAIAHGAGRIRRRKNIAIEGRTKSWNAWKFSLLTGLEEAGWIGEDEVY